MSKEGDGKRSRPQVTSAGHGAASEAQRLAAIGAICAAQDDATAARAAGVSERTLRRWRAEDEAFRAELASQLEAVKRANAERASGLLGKAMDVLSNALDEGDSTVALGVFRQLTATKNEHTGKDGAPLIAPVPKDRASQLEELKSVHAQIGALLAKESA